MFGAGERATVRDDPRELPFPRQYPWLAAAVQPPIELGVSPNTVADKHCSRMNATAQEDIVVFITRREGKCAECGRGFFKGNWIRLENEKALCLDCADLVHLEFLPRGNTALTRRATAHSPLRAVVVQWSRSRQRYERQGILVTAAAIQSAEESCLADADVRERRRQRAAKVRETQEVAYSAEVADALRAGFPGCPPDEVARIAEWTCEKYSGRVGRSAAAKSLDPQALRLAVIARIRHEHTRYDTLLMQHGDRRLARVEVRAEIDRILQLWEAGIGVTAEPGGPRIP